MTAYQARARRNRAAWYDGLLVDQSVSTDITLDDLRDFDTELVSSGATQALVAVDQPAPARGYALLFRVSPVLVAARIHVLEGQPDEAYKALFSQAFVQADRIVGDTVELHAILVDTLAAAPHVVDAVERLGEPYRLTLHDTTLTEADAESEPEDTGTGEEGTVSHVIIIDYNNDANDVKSLLVTEGDLIERPSDPARADGKPFLGWAAENPDAELEDGETPYVWQYDFDTPVTGPLYIAATYSDEPVEPAEPTPEKAPVKRAPRRAPAKRAPTKKTTK